MGMATAQGESGGRVMMSFSPLFPDIEAHQMAIRIARMDAATD